jgi:hypothetical protein
MINEHHRTSLAPGFVVHHVSTYADAPSRGERTMEPRLSMNGAASINEILAERITDEMQRELTEKETWCMDTNTATDSFARSIIYKVQSHVKSMLQAGNKVEAEILKRIPSPVPVAGNAPPSVSENLRPKRSYKDLIPVGTKFTKSVDILGSFEGVVVGTPNETTPFYQIEYEDRGSEALLHRNLVDMLNTSELESTRPPLADPPPPPMPAPDDATTEETMKLMEARILVARDQAYQQTCLEIIRQNRPAAGVDS